MAARVVVLEDLRVAVALFGHPDGTELTHPDAVTEARAVERERRRSGTGPLR